MRKPLLIIALVLLAGVSVLLWAITAQQPNHSDNKSSQGVYLYENAEIVAANHSFVWDADIIGSTSDATIDSKFSCPTSSKSAYVFLAKRGLENEPQSGWQAYAEAYLDTSISGVRQPNLKISGLIGGEPGPRYIQRTGGDYSLGLACSHDGMNKIDSTSYVFVQIEAESGNWKIVQ
jgi:hypothetical protein